MKGMCNRRSGNKRIYRKKRLEVEERERMKDMCNRRSGNKRIYRKKRL